MEIKSVFIYTPKLTEEGKILCQYTGKEVDMNAWCDQYNWIRSDYLNVPHFAEMLSKGAEAKGVDLVVPESVIEDVKFLAGYVAGILHPHGLHLVVGHTMTDGYWGKFDAEHETNIIQEKLFQTGEPENVWYPSGMNKRAA